MVSAQMNNMFENGLTIFVGSFLGLNAAGIYDRADQMTRKPMLQVIEVAWRVMFPTLANFKQKTNFSRIYRDMLLASTFGMLTLGMVLLIFIPVFLDLANLDQWSEIIPFVPWLIAWGGLVLSGSVNSMVMQALDVPQWDTFISSIRLLVSLALICHISY